MQNRSFVGENTLKTQGAYTCSRCMYYCTWKLKRAHLVVLMREFLYLIVHKWICKVVTHTKGAMYIRSVYCTCTHNLCMHTPVQEGLKTFPFQSVSLSFHSLPKSCSFTVGIGSVPLRSVQNRCRTCVGMRAVISERHCEHISSITSVGVGTAFPLLRVYAKKKTLFHSPARESLPRLRSACHAEFTTERKLNGKGTANGTKLCV